MFNNQAETTRSHYEFAEADFLNLSAQAWTDEVIINAHNYFESQAHVIPDYVLAEVKRRKLIPHANQ